MKIYSPTHEPDTFQKLRRKTWKPWHYLYHGEWSQSPYHEGRKHYFYAVDTTLRYVALMECYFPKRIVSITEKDPDLPIETILGRLLGHAHRYEDSYIDLPYEYAKKLDFDQIMDEYYRFMEATRPDVERE